MSFYYPPLDSATLKALEVIQALVADDPTGYFAESPYGSETDSQLAKWFKPPPPPRNVGVLPPVEDIDPETGEPVEPQIWEGLREEIKQAYLHLKGAKKDKHQDKVAWAKNAVNLLEKLVKMDAQAVNIEMVGNFQREVIDILEQVCTPAQRDQIALRIQDMTSPNIEKLVAAATADEPEEEGS